MPRYRKVTQEKQEIEVGGRVFPFDYKFSTEEILDINKDIREILGNKNIFEELPEQGIGYIISDLHANIKSLKKILEITQFEEKIRNGEEISLIFLGDYIDKGDNNLLLLYVVFYLKLLYPDNIFILRGNHETIYFFGRFMSFRKEVKKTFKKNAGKILDSFYKTFDYLPIIAVSKKGIVAMHGGPPKSMTLYGLTRIGMHEILWSDIKRGRRNSSNSWYRLNKGHKIGIKDVELFLDNLGMDVLFRGHSHTMKGVEALGDKIMTIISANSLARFGQSLGSQSQCGFVEINLEENIKNISQVKTIFFTT